MMKFQVFNESGNSSSPADHLSHHHPSVHMTEQMMDSVDHLSAMRSSEERMYPLCEDYLCPPPSDTVNSSTQVDYCTAAATSAPQEHDEDDHVSEAWRRKLCEWMYQVVDHFSFDRDVVSYALSYLDQAAAATTSAQRSSSTLGDAAIASQPNALTLPKRDYQLLAVTSLYMAIKIHGQSDDQQQANGESLPYNGVRRKLRLSAFVELSRGFFSAEAIEETEQRILELLKWRVNPPSCQRFISSFLVLCPTQDWSMSVVGNDGRISPSQNTQATSILRSVSDIARYLTELSVCVSWYSFECTKSITAYASILCAIEALGVQQFPDHVRVAFFHNIHSATGLVPEDAKHVYIKLKDLCPTLFVENGLVLPEFDTEPSDLLSEAEAVMHQSASCLSNIVDLDGDDDDIDGKKEGSPFQGKVSPVSVVDTAVATLAVAAASSKQNHVSPSGKIDSSRKRSRHLGSSMGSAPVARGL